MDTSEEYIKMCEKAEEIQELRREEHNSNTGKWQAGDFWTTLFNSDRGKAFVVPRNLDAWADIPHYIHHPIECIWLPRQDQLQEMVDWLGNYNLVFAGYPKDIGMRVNKLSSYYDLRMASMEQLWLAFVMKEKYHKIWDNNKEEWNNGH